MSENKTDRRHFLKKSSAALTVLPLAAAASDASAIEATEHNGKFQPEEFWCERMKAPEDGKKYDLKDGDWIELTSYYSTELEKQSFHDTVVTIKKVGWR